MPTYEYLCAKCQHDFDIVQSITADALTVCPKEFCPKKPWGKGKIKRVIGAGAGIIFKGSGFYITDYRSDKYKAAAKQDSSSNSSSSSSTPSTNTGKSESKPASSGGSAGPAAAPAAPAPAKKD